VLSLRQLRKNLYSVFKLLSSSGMTLEIVYDGVVYDLTVLKTDKVPNVTRPKRQAIPEIRHIDMAVCEQCGSMMFNHVCMSRNCINANPVRLDVQNQMKSGKL
jgi:hypothetical protein